MDKIDYKELEKIPVPEDLEERLSMQIDMWEKQEKAARKHNILLGIRQHNNEIRKTNEAMDLLFYAFQMGTQNTDDAIDFLF